jgi:hypothetical protein
MLVWRSSLSLSAAAAAELFRYVTRAMSKDAATESDVFAAAAARKRALAAQFAARPVEDVIGLVDARGKGGWPEKGDRWTLSFTFHCWKVPPGPMKTRRLSVNFFTTSRQQYDSLWERVHSYSVVRIRARVVEESVIGTSQAELVEFLGPDSSDSEMNQAAVDLQKPVVHQDHQFGQFTLDRRVNWYTAETEWNGAVVALNLTLDDSGTIDAALQAARMLWKDQKQWAKRIEDYAVQELLPLKNESWLDEGEVELSADVFKARMTLESVTVEPDRSFDFWHNDGDLFWGHSIQISGNLSEGPTRADIPG